MRLLKSLLHHLKTIAGQTNKAKLIRLGVNIEGLTLALRMQEMFLMLNKGPVIKLISILDLLCNLYLDVYETKN